jgi:hypothetical protein
MGAPRMPSARYHPPRQDRIWKHLGDALDPQERTKIVFIVTDTPEEWRVLHEAAGH